MSVKDTKTSLGTSEYMGGDHIRGSWSTEPRKEQTEKVVEALSSVVEEMVW